MIQFTFILIFSLLFDTSVAKQYPTPFNIVPGRIYWVRPREWGVKNRRSMPHPVVALGTDLLTNDLGVLVVEITHKEIGDTMIKPLKNFFDSGTTMIPPPWDAASTGTAIDDDSVINVGRARVVLAFGSVVKKAAWDLDMKPEDLKWIVDNIGKLKMEQSRPIWLSMHEPVYGMGETYRFKYSEKFKVKKHIQDKLKKESRLIVQSPAVHTLDVSTAPCTGPQRGDGPEKLSCAASKNTPEKEPDTSQPTAWAPVAALDKDSTISTVPCTGLQGGNRQKRSGCTSQPK